MGFSFPVISADSHITEPPDTYTANIDPAWRDKAPSVMHDEELGDLFVAEGMKPIKMGLVAAAGKQPEDIRTNGTFDDMHRSGWDASVRLADQDRDGVSAEILYPTVGMLLCNLRTSTTRGPASTPTTAGSSTTARSTGTASSASARPLPARSTRPSPTSTRSRPPGCGA